MAVLGRGGSYGRDDPVLHSFFLRRYRRDGGIRQKKADMATGIQVFKLPWHKAGPLNQLADKADSDQLVVNKEVCFSQTNGKAWFAAVTRPLQIEIHVRMDGA